MTSIEPNVSPAGPVLLVAEDSESDRLILREAFNDLGVTVRLRFVVHGEEILDYLHGRADYGADSAAPRPDLILMDINMPRMNGIEALKQIRSDSGLRMLPVIILSTSDNPNQITQAYDHGVNAFMTKPGRFDDLVDLLRSFSAFWLSAAQLPTNAA